MSHRALAPGDSAARHAANDRPAMQANTPGERQQSGAGQSAAAADQGQESRGDNAVPAEGRNTMAFADEHIGPNEFPSLGDMLIYLRRSYSERVEKSHPGGARVTTSAQAVANCLATHGYSMTSGSYSMLERGNTLPKNPESFFEAIGKCLAIDTSSKYWALLRFQYLYDHALRSVGVEFAEQHFPHGERALKLLKSGEL